MDDAKYLFIQTAKERKQAGRGDFCKKRRGGRGVRLPSDHLTRKEKQKMNGEVKTYDLSKPINWGEFKTWPLEHQAAYLRRLDSKYRVTNKQIGEMFGVAAATIVQRRKMCGAHAIQGQHKWPDMAAWEAFCKGEAEEEPTPETEPETHREAVREPAKDSAELNNVAILLKTLAGTGAKITIELTL